MRITIKVLVSCLFMAVSTVSGFSAEEARDCWVLSVDGGGVRGGLPAAILSAIEKRLGMKTSDIFDVSGGTSIGALICTFLNLPGKKDEKSGRTTSKYSASDLLPLFEQEKGRIFRKRSWLISRILHSIYDTKTLEDLVSHYYEEHAFDALVKPTVTFATDLFKGTVKAFESWNCDEKHSTMNALLASTAAPFFFKSRTLCPIGEKEPISTFIDGGLLINDPTIEVVAAARKLYPTARIHVISLGTGLCQESIFTKAFRSIRHPISAIHTVATDVVDAIIVRRQSAVAQYHMEKLHQGEYWRLNPIISGDHLGLDDISQENTDHLQKVAKDFVENNPMFEELIASLRKSKGLDAESERDTDCKDYKK